MVDIGAAGGRVSDPYIVSENQQHAARACTPFLAERYEMFKTAV